MQRHLSLAALAGLCLTAPAFAQEQMAEPTHPVATAEIVNAEGQALGTVTLTQGTAGVLIQISLDDLPPGGHGLHIHQVGSCEPPTFESAGGHLNPTDAMHGILNPEGPHFGDLPNLYAGEDGSASADMVSTLVSLEADAQNSLLDEDGSALMVHSGPDDYATDPSGNSGDRIACGVIQASAP